MCAGDQTAFPRSCRLRTHVPRRRGSGPDGLDTLLQPGVTLAVENTADELALNIGGREALLMYYRPDTLFLAARERAMNALVYRLYNLTPEEIATVEAG